MLCNMFCVFVQLSVSHSNLSAGRGEYVPTTEEQTGERNTLADALKQADIHTYILTHTVRTEYSIQATGTVAQVWHYNRRLMYDHPVRVSRFPPPAKNLECALVHSVEYA